MKHAIVRWNPATREHFCVRCGRTSDATSIADAQERLEKFDCVVTKEAAIQRRIEVKVGSRSVIVE